MRGFLIFVAAVVLVFGGLVVAGYLLPHDYVGICTNTKTHVRQPDKDCQPAKGEDDWTFYDANSDIPAVGQEADDGAVDAPEPDDEVKRGGVPAQGQQGDSNSDENNNGNTGGDFEPAGGGGSDVGVNSGDEGGDENYGSGGGEDGE